MKTNTNPLLAIKMVTVINQLSVLAQSHHIIKAVWFTGIMI